MPRTLLTVIALASTAPLSEAAWPTTTLGRESAPHHSVPRPAFSRTRRSNEPSQSIRPYWLYINDADYPNDSRQPQPQQEQQQANTEEDELVKGEVEVSCDIELPFSAEVAFDAYSDLSRQPTWSSWLRSVKPVEGNPLQSKFKTKMGMSWTSEATANNRPYLIAWKSVSGMHNKGKVQFEPTGPNSSKMIMHMKFTAPRMIRNSKHLESFVREKMLKGTMNNFKNAIQEELE